MGSNTRNAYELKAGANKLEEINIAFELTDEALATVSAGSGQDIYLYSELSKNYAITPFNENVYDPVHDVTTTDFSSYHWSLVSQTYASDAAAQYALAAAEAASATASATKAELEAWEAEAEKKTADSYATQLYNEVVIVYTSNGDGAFTETPTTEYSSLHYAEAAQFYSETALSNSEAVNLVAGMVMEWHSDRKPTGYLWCDGESYTVFSPTPATAYDELYQALVDPTYIMTTKPLDWDGLYPLNPNGWYNPADPDYQAYHDQSALPDTAELTLTVTVPDKRGVFTRGKDQAGTVLPARGIDSNGVVDFSTIKWSQNKAHTHILSNSYLGIRSGDGPTDDNNSGGPDAMDTITMSEEGGVEGYGTYQTANYIIRTKGVYNGDGSGSGGSSITPIASEIEVVDTYNNGVTNLQESTDDLYYKNGLERVDVGQYIPPVEAVTGEIYDSYNLGSQLFGKWLVIGDSTGVYILDTDAGTNTKILTGDYRGIVTADYANGYIWVISSASIYRIGFDISDGSVLSIESIADADARHSCAVHPTDMNKIYCTSYNDIVLYDVIEDTVVNYGAIFGTSPLLVTNGTDLFKIVNGQNSVNRVNVTTATPTLEATTFVLPYLLYIKSETKIHYSFDSDNSMCLQLSSSQRFFIIDFNYDTGLISEREEIVKPATGNTALPHPSIVCQDARYGKRTWLVRVSTDSAVYYWNTDPANRKYAYKLQNSVSVSSGSEAVGLGVNVTMQNEGGAAVGKNNLDLSDTLFEVGIGIDTSNKGNGFQVHDTGDVQAPNRLAVPNPFSLLTKDISDTLYNNYAPTGHTGDIVVDSGGGTTVTTISVANGLITGVVVV